MGIGADVGINMVFGGASMTGMTRITCPSMSRFVPRGSPASGRLFVILVVEPVPLDGSEGPRRGLCRLVREGTTAAVRRLPPPRQSILVCFSHDLSTAYAVTVLVARQSRGSGAQDTEDHGNRNAIFVRLNIVVSPFYDSSHIGWFVGWVKTHAAYCCL
jgi:hypothetical protein